MIREATPADARALAELLVRTWQRNYGDFIGPEDMPDVDDREARIRAALREQAWWVYDLDGRIAGFVAIQAAAGELRGLYVEPAAQGAGLGSVLLEHGEGALRDAGVRDAHLWVFAENGHGRHFYGRRGWALDPGAETPEWVARAVRYRKAL